MSWTLPGSRRFRPGIESLEDRRLLAAGVREEYALELINRLRTDPADELPLLLNSTDPGVVSALAYFHVDRQVLAQQWATLTPAPPLAWNDVLAGTALAHTRLMAQFDQQAHQLPGEPSLTQRITTAGYRYTWVGENIYAYATDVFDAHAGFAIDWGPGPTGIQDPPDHRINLMNPLFRDVGIGLVDQPPGHATGPLLVTEDFGQPAAPAGNPFLVGAVFADADGDNFYSPGEGVGGVTVSLTGPAGTFTTTTTLAGGYQLQLPAGDYTATFSGGGLAAPVVKPVSVGTTNVLLNVNTALGIPPSAGRTTADTGTPPPVQTRPILARLVPVRAAGRARREVEVFFADTGTRKSRFVAPFQGRGFRNLQVTVRDSNGDGLADLVVVTARRGRRTVSADFPG